jgi:hypothetical protein
VEDVRFRVPVLVALALLPAAGAAGAGTDPKSYVLELRDLPTGFDLISGRSVDNETAARESRSTLAQFRAWGRLGGYDRTFERKVDISRPIKGAALIESAASVYRTAEGAHASLAETRTGCAKPPSKRLPVVARIGHERILCAVVHSAGGHTYQTYAVLWRRGNVKATALATGIRGGISKSEAIALARTQDARIARTD